MSGSRLPVLLVLFLGVAIHGVSRAGFDEALKAYLMLNDPARFDAAALKAWITFDWERSLPRDLTIEQRQALEAHLDSMMERGAVASPVPADENLIASVRTMLSQYALASRVYGRLKRQGVGGDIQEFTVIKAAGPAAPRVFTRLSGQPLTKGVPGLFTYDGYYKAFKRESDKVANELADEEGWVLDIKDAGVAGRLTDAAGRERLTEDVRRLYLTDYAKTWDDFLNDVKLIRPGDIHQTIEVARILSAIDNPLAPFLRAASRETTLVKPEGEKDLAERATDKLAKEARRKLGYMFGTEVVATTPKPASEPIEYIVDRRFESLRRYVTSASQGQPAPVDQAIALVGELHTMLNAADSAIKSKAAPPASDVPNKVKAQAPSMRMSPRFMPMSQAKNAAPTGPSPMATITTQSPLPGDTVSSNRVAPVDGSRLSSTPSEMTRWLQTSTVPARRGVGGRGPAACCGLRMKPKARWDGSIHCAAVNGLPSGSNQTTSAWRPCTTLPASQSARRSCGNSRRNLIKRATKSISARPFRKQGLSSDVPAGPVARQGPSGTDAASDSSASGLRSGGSDASGRSPRSCAFPPTS